MLLGFSISGVTPGYERFDYWTTTDDKMSSILKAKSLVLDNSRINIPPGDGEIIRIRRFLQEGNLVVYTCIYKHAFETGRARGGGYMSAGVWLSGEFLEGVVLLPLLRKILLLIDGACCRNAEFVSRLDKSGSIFRDKLRAEYDNIANKPIPLRCDFKPAELSGNSMFYDFSNLGDGAETWLADYLQASWPHSSCGDIFLTTSKKLVEGAQRPRGMEIVNEFHLPTMELTGPPVSPSTGRVDRLIEVTSMPAGSNIRSSTVDASAFKSVMTKIGTIEQQLGSVVEEN